jgi:hypothetical protein
MELCYPTILLLFLGLFIVFQAGKGLHWKAGPIFASPAFIFATLSYILCQKGYKKLAWFMPLVGLIGVGALFAGV